MDKKIISRLFSLLISLSMTLTSAASTTTGGDKVLLQKWFFEQIKKGNVNNVKVLLNKGASLYHANNSGLTPLHVAVFFNRPEVAHSLIQAKAFIDACNTQDHATPLHDAVDEGNLTMVKLLLRFNADFTCQDNEDYTPLYKAEQKSKAASNPVEKANRAAITKLLLEARERKEKQSSLTKNNKLLLDAARDGTSKEVERLLQAGANIEAKNQNDWTPLHKATYYGHQNVVELLIEKGAHKEAVDQEGCTPLHKAAWNGHKKVVGLLINKGAQVNVVDESGWTPLHDATRNGHTEVVRLLIENGAQINAVDQDGCTPLHLAALYGNKAIVGLLIEKSAHIEAVDKDGSIPLHLATYSGHTEVVRLLIDKRANIKAVTKDAWTPLHLAAQGGHQEAAYLLIEQRAHVNAVDTYNKTPLEWAQKKGLKEIVEMLLIAKHK